MRGVDPIKVSRVNLLAALTEREREMANLVCNGLSNKDIARRLEISEGTIKLHLHHIYHKLSMANRTALAVCCAKAAL